jgi:WD40 repeat protein
MKFRMVNKACQYETLQLDPSLVMSDEIQMKIKVLLKRTLPTVEQAMQKNELLVKPYTHAQERCSTQEQYKNKLDPTHDVLKEAGCFNDLTYSNGKAILCIDWHPHRKNIIAMSVSNPTLSSKTNDSSTHTPNYILLWKLNQQKQPFMVLLCPYECCSFRFNPTNPNIAVAGCSNGQIVMWDMKERILRLEANDQAEGRLSGNDKAISDLSPIQPYALSRLEEHHKNKVNDLCWLPISMHVDSNGEPLSKDNLSSQSFQFITVSGCEISFWDTRFRDIPTGKPSHTLKPRKAGTTAKHEKKGMPKILHFDWVPTFRSKISHFERRSHTTPITRLVYLYGKFNGAPDNQDSSEDLAKASYKSTSIYCATEEGDLALINWKTAIVNSEDRVISKSAKDGSMRTLMEKSRHSEELLPDVVQWSIHDHFGRIVSLEQSPFFPQILLSVSCWGFHVWNMLNHSRKKPLFISSHPSTIYTVGRWSPSRPGLILLAKVDGSIDVWDFMNSFYVPTKTQLVTHSHITSMEILQDLKSSFTSVAVGDSSGSLTLLDIPMILSGPQPNEREEMVKFFQLPI